MYLKIITLTVILAIVLLEVNGRPQFNWNDYDDFQSSTTRRPSRPTRPRPTRRTTTRTTTISSDFSDSSTTDVTSTTTTTASPQFTACMSSCQATPEYNPVCGSDRVTYSNRNRLRCAVRCGLNVQELFQGQCSR